VAKFFAVLRFAYIQEMGHNKTMFKVVGCGAMQEPQVKETKEQHYSQCFVCACVAIYETHLRLLTNTIAYDFRS